MDLLLPTKKTLGLYLKVYHLHFNINRNEYVRIMRL